MRSFIGSRRNAAFSCSLAVALAIWGGVPAIAQGNASGGSFPVVQALPPTALSDLNGALRRLGENPRDLAALIDAGNASIVLGDFEAAAGFFGRAALLAPADYRAKAGLGSAMVRQGNPYDALLMFEEAQKAGAPAGALAGDWGLAFDLVGENARAQELYRTALARGGDDEITRRLALSLAVSGDRKGGEAALRPQLERGDQTAYRTRAFALAIQGDIRESQEIVRRIMPGDMAARITPYLRYMPQLTPAQQVAAANFGHFPRAADIGRDDPRVVARGGSPSRVASVGGSDSALIPQGEPLGRKDGKRKAGSDRDQRTASSQPAAMAAATPSAQQADAKPGRAGGVAASTAQPGFSGAAVAAAPSPPSPPASWPQTLLPSPPAPRPAQPGVTQPRPSAVASSAPATSSTGPTPARNAAMAPAPANAPVASAAPLLAASPPPSVPPPSAAALARAEYGPPADDSPRAAAAPIASPPAPSVAPSAPVQPASVAEAFADFVLPPPTAPDRAGAVDLRTIVPPREPKPAPKPAPEAEAATADKPGLARDAKSDPAQGKGGKDASAGKDTPAAKDRATSDKPSARDKSPAKVEPAKPKQPSRVWVQVATGRDRDALAFDWRRFNRNSAALFRNREAHVAKWGQANRLLTGPFKDRAAAQDFLRELEKARIDAFLFVSKDGETVEPLAGGTR